MERSIALVLSVWSVSILLLILRYQYMLDEISRSLQPPALPILNIHSSLRKGTTSNNSPKEARKDDSYDSLMRELFDLGTSNPKQLIRELSTKDPFMIAGGIKTFQCPNDRGDHALDFPSQVNISRLKAFQDKERGSWVFYQHLRKAGGTGFCDLAHLNLPEGSIPPYYCMPDRRGSLATPPWNNPSHLLDEMSKKNYRIAANEWDAFSSSFFDLEGAVFATTFRHPIDRRYSQYRFEVPIL